MASRHCALALTCIKIESLFSCLCKSCEAVIRGVREFNRRLCSEGLRALPRWRRDGESLVYVCRSRKLARGLKDEHALCFSKRLRILYGQREQKAGADCPCFPLRFRSVQIAHDRIVDMAASFIRPYPSCSTCTAEDASSCPPRSLSDATIIRGKTHMVDG